MIRIFNNSDVEEINIIGKSIKDNFDILNNYNEVIEQIYVYEMDNRIVGFIHISNIYNEVDIINVAVLEEYRNKKIATSLIEFIINNIKPNKIMLEVRESNDKAINLYKKIGFNIIHTRKKYYGNEDALIMELI